MNPIRNRTLRRAPVRSTVLALGTVLGALATLLGGSASAVEVIGDDEHDRFVGSGAVFLPRTVSGEARVTAVTCHGCRWKVTTPCLRDEEHSDAGCRGSVLGCAQGREIGRAWLARPGGDFEPVGLFCPTDGDVTAVADMNARVAGSMAREVPDLAPACAPERGVVVGIDLHCRSGQDSPAVNWVDSIAGYTIETTARANWQWSFQEHGISGPRTWVHSVDFPGADYPDAGIRQAFTSTGRHIVDVRATWRGTYTVDGLGPFAVPQPVQQSARLRVPVGSALGVLHAG